MPELNWIGKAAVVKHHKEVPFRLLEPDLKLNCGDPESGNLIVEGDNGILNDRSDLGGNVLNQRTLDYLQRDFPHDGLKTIYGARSRYQPARLKAAQIEFKQLPYSIDL